MEKIDIVFERNLSGSYMKIKADDETGFDERMLMKQQIPGLLSMEKCYMDGYGQFWYDISGKQSLDTFCRMKPVGQAFLEQMIHSICDELGMLEQHLVDVNCLCLAPEVVYVSNRTGELSFTAIPGQQGDIATGFRELMEYMLTRVDHKDAQAVQLAYDIYEKTLDEGYSIADIHSSIIQSHIAEAPEAVQPQGMAESAELSYPPVREQQEAHHGKKREEPRNMPVAKRIGQPLSDQIAGYLASWKEKIQQCIPSLPKGRKGKRPTEWKVVYPEDEIPEEVHNQIHPTVCLSDYREHPEGLLLYEGYENFSNIRLENRSHQIGQSDDSDITIAKDTISRYHARIECEDKEYFLEDLNSTNGTFVNEKQLTYKEKRKLESNDIIRFADVTYRFV